jgi:hypothetical protein
MLAGGSMLPCSTRRQACSSACIARAAQLGLSVRLVDRSAEQLGVAVAAEGALAESRAGQQAKRAADLVRALEVAGYAQASAAAHVSV